LLTMTLTSPTASMLMGVRMLPPLPRSV
jgi:hypothetical protein